MASVLLVDDDVDLVDMNRLVLGARGHAVCCAYSAAEARQRLAEHRPDLVVLDVMMETDRAGIDLALELQRDCPGLPTVILSGLRGVTQRDALPEDLEALPVVTFLNKPVDPTALAKVIEAILAQK